MIRLILPASPEAAHAEAMLRAHPKDVFGCKLAANRAAYGWEGEGSQANLLYEGARPVGLLGLLDGQAILLCDTPPPADTLEELACYLRMAGVTEWMGDAAVGARLAGSLPGWTSESSVILQAAGYPPDSAPPPDPAVVRNGPSDGIFELLRQPFGLDPAVKAGFEADLRLRIDRWICDLYAIYDGDGQAISTLTVTRAPGLRLIGSVATAPAHRGRGLAGRLIETVRTVYAGETLAVMALHEGVVGFYIQHTFCPVGRWSRLRAPTQTPGDGQ